MRPKPVCATWENEAIRLLFEIVYFFIKVHERVCARGLRSNSNISNNRSSIKVVRDAEVFEAGDTGRNSTLKSLNSLSMF